MSNGSARALIIVVYVTVYMTCPTMASAQERNQDYLCTSKDVELYHRYRAKLVSPKEMLRGLSSSCQSVAKMDSQIASGQGSAGPSKLRLPTRIFSGPDEFPPTAFAAYGIITFPSRANTATLPRHQMICEAYVAGLLHSVELGQPSKSQMVTVWPVEDNGASRQLNQRSTANFSMGWGWGKGENTCQRAVSRYGLLLSQQAMQIARQSGVALTGRGPFLLAWSPSDRMGTPDALVLVSDLSNVTNVDQAQDVIRRWSRDIQENPELWQRGWNVEKVRQTIRLWADSYGPKVLSIFGAKD